MKRRESNRFYNIINYFEGVFLIIDDQKTLVYNKLIWDGKNYQKRNDFVKSKILSDSIILNNAIIPFIIQWDEVIEETRITIL